MLSKCVSRPGDASRLRLYSEREENSANDCEIVNNLGVLALVGRGLGFEFDGLVQNDPDHSQLWSSAW